MRSAEQYSIYRALVRILDVIVLRLVLRSFHIQYMLGHKGLRILWVSRSEVCLYNLAFLLIIA